MKKIYILLLFIPFLTFSCKDDNEDRHGPEGTEQKVDFEVAFSKQYTRTPVPDAGTAEERNIARLNLIVFDQGGGYLYTREAYKQVSGEYRATLTETAGTDKLKVYLIANCQSIIAAQKDTWAVGDTWDVIGKTLIDNTPERLINANEFQPLPMFGEVEGQVLTTQVNKWGPVMMFRSVASADLYIEKNDKNKDFELKALYGYFMANKGYLPAFENGKDLKDYTKYQSPDDMTSNKTLEALGVGTYIFNKGEATEKSYTGVANQLYMYDNDGTNGFSRLIVCGYYKQKEKLSYYPIDFAYSDGGSAIAGKFRPLIRNWKHVFKVAGVNGPGYSSLEEAAQNWPVDLDTEVINWNQEEGEIGVSGQYYVAMKRKNAILEREEGSIDQLKMAFRIEDDILMKEFKLEFKDEKNGALAEGSTATNIANEYFRVELADMTDNDGIVKVTALKDYTADHDTDTVILTFRNLKFEISITQLNRSDLDWENGGDINQNLQ